MTVRELCKEAEKHGFLDAEIVRTNGYNVLPIEEATYVSEMYIYSLEENCNFRITNKLVLR